MSTEGILVTGERRHHSGEKKIKWDEEAIEEHDKERGTRMKIEEPNTPFVRSPLHSDDEDEGPHVSHPHSSTSSGAPLSLESLEAAFDRAEGKVRIDFSVPAMHEDELKKKDFKEKRAQHYNMGSALRAKQPVEEEDEEGDKAMRGEGERSSEALKQLRKDHYKMDARALLAKRKSESEDEE